MYSSKQSTKKAEPIWRVLNGWSWVIGSSDIRIWVFAILNCRKSSSLRFDEILHNLFFTLLQTWSSNLAATDLAEDHLAAVMRQLLSFLTFLPFRSLWKDRFSAMLFTQSRPSRLESRAEHACAHRVPVHDHHPYLYRARVKDLEGW